MATIKDRINVSVSRDVKTALTLLARRDEVPIATKTLALIEMALELEEDRYFSKLSDQRLKGKVRWLTHKEVWGKKKNTR